LGSQREIFHIDLQGCSVVPDKEDNSIAKDTMSLQLILNALKAIIHCRNHGQGIATAFRHFSREPGQVFLGGSQRDVRGKIGQIQEKGFVVIPVSTLDVGATVIESAGLEIDAELDGMNLLTLMADTVLAGNRPLYWRHTGQGAIRVGNWKYLRSAEYEYLFNLQEDPSESNNLLSMHPERVGSLRAQWYEWNDSLQRPFTGILTAEQIKWDAHYFGQAKGKDN